MYTAQEIRKSVTQAAKGKPITMGNYRKIAEFVHPIYEVNGQKQIDFANRERNTPYDDVIKEIDVTEGAAADWFGMACYMVATWQLVKYLGGYIVTGDQKWEI